MNYSNVLVWKQKVFFEPQKEKTTPVDWLKKDSGYQNIIVEVGFGNGEFLGLLAENNPESLIVGFDISLSSCVRAVKKCMAENLSNVVVLKENARPMLRELFADNSVSKIFMNFPDPWPKRKHETKRTINEGFLSILAAVLEKEGSFELVTDQEWYGRQSKNLFESSGYFKVHEYQVNPGRIFQTKYEKKWLSLNRNVYRLLVQKTKFNPINRLLSGDDMPHVIIKKELPAEKIVNALKQLENNNGSVFYKIKEIHRNIQSDDFLLRMISVDDDIIQKFYLVIQKREQDWIVKLEDITQPFRTPAVKQAVLDIGRVLNSL